MAGTEESKQIYTFGENIIWCKETCISGKKYYFMLFSFLSYTLPFIAVLVVIFLTNQSSSFLFTKILMCLFFSIEVYSMIRVGCTDPGILPKQNNDNCLKKRYPRKSVIRGHLYDLNYCFSCDIFKPPRANHCSKCDNCVQQLDHHCGWIGNDVGIRNYKFFYLLVSCIFINYLYQISFCLYILLNRFIKGNIDEKTSILIVISLSSIILYDLLFLLFFLGKIFFLETYLCSINLLYYDYIKKKNKKHPGYNLYNISFLYNIKHIFCKKVRKSICLDKPYNKLDEEKIQLKENGINSQENNNKSPKNKKNMNDMNIFCNENGNEVLKANIYNKKYTNMNNTYNYRKNNNNTELNSELRRINNSNEIGNQDKSSRLLKEENIEVSIRDCIILNSGQNKNTNKKAQAY